MQQKSCGAVVVKENRYILIKHKKGHWDFPKGKMEPGESEHETASREVLEETGVKIKFIDGFREEIFYAPKPRIKKTVVVFKATTSDDLFTEDEDIIDLRWATYEEAMQVLTFDAAKDVLRKANSYHFST